MKKLLALLSICCLLMLSLAGCTSKTTSESGTTEEPATEQSVGTAAQDTGSATDQAEEPAEEAPAPTEEATQ